VSKHWDSRPALRAQRERKLPREWRVYQPRQRTTFTLAELGLALAGGLTLGFGYYFVTAPPAVQDSSFAIPADAVVPDYYAESRRSKALLEAQEAAPPSAWSVPRSRGGVVANPAAVQVIDGDTFVYNGMRFRIADIDTPETNPPRCAYEAQLGAQATQRLGELLAAGPFRLESIDRDTDRYGRKLRIVTRGGQSIGDQLVAEGLARTWTGRRQPWC
jgi:micrococcal nuclease